MRSLLIALGTRIIELGRDIALLLGIYQRAFERLQIGALRYRNYTPEITTLKATEGHRKP
jgi:hypothetical protein